MNRRSITLAFVWAISIGGIVALLNGDRRAVSLRLWLAAFAVWFAIALIRRLFEDTPLFPVRMRSFLGRPENEPVVIAARLRGIRALEVLLVRCRDSDRAFAQQLRPRLTELADHNLLLRHGIDRQADPDRAARLLGDVAWLIDATVVDRSPTPAEIDAFLSAIENPSRPPRISSEEAA